MPDDIDDYDPLPPPWIINMGPVALEIDGIIRFVGGVERPQGRLDMFCDGWRYALHSGPRGTAWLASHDAPPPAPYTPPDVSWQADYQFLLT